MSKTAKHLKSFKIPFDCMEPAIPTGSSVIGHVNYYSSHTPERWEVAVFSIPGKDGQFIKRIVGLPGETIKLASDGLRINGSVVPPPAELKGSFAKFKPDSGEFTIPGDSVFLMGDNQAIEIADSRQHGAVPISNLEAKVFAAVRVDLM
jgi:signal peptidase I